MNTVELMLTFAIAALAILAVLSGIFNPIFNPGAELAKVVEKEMKEAQALPGTTTISKTIQVNGNESLSASFLTTQLRKVGFSCLDSTYCCTQKSNCTLPANVNQTQLILREKSTLHLSIRCDDAPTIQTCVVFVGKTPGQVHFKTVPISNSISLNATPRLSPSITIENTGDLPVEKTVTLKAKLFKSITENDLSDYEFVREAQSTSVEKIASNQTILIPIEIPVLSEGKYKLELRVESEDGGFETKTHIFTATGNASLCQIDASGQESPVRLNDQSCAQKSNCVGTCTAAFECQNAWKNSNPASVFESGTASYAYEIVDDALCG